MNYFKTLDRKNSDSIKWQMGKEIVGHDDYLVFSVADSDYEVAKEIKEALLKRIEHGAFGYAKPSKEYINIHKQWFLDRYHLKVSDNWILPVPKVLSALSVILKTFSLNGDQVMIQTPVYHVFEPMIKDNDRTLINNPLIYKDGVYSMDFELLEKQFKEGVKIMILTNPHNPVGRVWTPHELDKLVSLAKKYNVLIASDEIHSDIIMENHKFHSLGHYFDKYDNIIIIGAGSKTFNIAGLHSAHIIVKNTKLRGQLKKAYSALHMMGPNNLAQKAIMAAYQSCGYWVDAQNEHILKNYNLLKTFIQTHFKKGYVVPLEGTYLAWVQIDFTNVNSKTFCEDLAKKHGVVVADGAKFGGNGEKFIRMNLACSKEQLKEGLNRMKAYIDTLKNLRYSST